MVQSSDNQHQGVEEDKEQQVDNEQEAHQQEFTSEDIDSLKQQLVEEQKKAEEYFNKLQYLRADFENYKKRASREVDEQVKQTKVELFRKLLGVIDNLERAVEASRNREEDDPLVEGVEMVLDQFKSILKEEGVSELEAVGQKFDPKYHEAIAFKEADENNIILEENQKGYCMGDTIIRPSIVIVGRRCDNE
ncbi:MAG: nucleotide exchange factor GrpE [Archaeoglobaceae archaeon]